MGDNLDSRWEVEHAADRATASSQRWRWHLLAFVPSLVLAVIVACVPLSQGLYADHESIAAQQAVEDILFAASCVPFALMYFGANLVLWLLAIFLMALGCSGR